MKFIVFAILLTAVFSSPAAISAQQAPLFFDAFLFDNAGQPAQDFNTFFQWQVTDGTVDLVGGSVPGATDQTNGRFVELGGSTNDAGVFSTRVPLPFTAGVTYNLTFDYKSSDGATNVAQIMIGDKVFNVSTNSTELQTFSRNFNFETTTMATLSFQSLDNDNNGIGIDNVVVTPQSVTRPILFFDFFLFDNAGQPDQDFNTFIQWDVTNGSVDLVGGNVPGATDQTNGRFVELGGSTNDAGNFATRAAFPFVPGLTYNLAFDYKSSDGSPNSAQVAVAGKTYTVTTSSTTLQNFNIQFTVDALTNTPIAFQNLGDDDNNGIGIDNVLLTQVVASTAAGVKIGGRATAKNRGIANTIIKLTDAQGNVRATRTSAFGYYSFANVSAGGTYIVSAESKKYVFAEQSQVVNVIGETGEVNFLGANR